MKRLIAFILLMIILAGCSSTPKPAVVPDRVFTVEEYPVVQRSVDQPTHFEFNDRIPKAALEKRKQWREVPPDRALDNLPAANARLAPFGYKLVPGQKAGSSDLYQGERLVVAELVDIGPVTVSASHKEFAFVAIQPGRGGVLVRSGALADWETGAHFFQPPVFVGEDLVAVRALDGEGYAVMRNDREVYRGQTGKWSVEIPVKRLAAFREHWVLEVAGDLIISGKSQKQVLGYDELFGWQLIDGRPFYFFRQGNSYGLSFGGEFQANRYDEIIHDKCCEPAVFNPSGNVHMIRFYARKGEMWHYVEAGIYE